MDTKRTADGLEEFLQDKGFPATTIHGDRSQEEREYVRAFCPETPPRNTPQGFLCSLAEQLPCNPGQLWDAAVQPS